MFDLLNIKPNQVSTDLSSYSSLLYSVPKGGKTTFAYESFGQECLFVAFEQGYSALSGVLAVDITKWADLIQLNKELKKEDVQTKFKVLVLDTVDIMHRYAVKHVCLKEGVQALGDIAHGKGYAMVDDLIFEMIKTWENLGYKLFFISHCKEKSEKLPSGGEIQKYIPSVERRTLNIVSKFVDNILFGYISMDAEGQEVRTLYTRETLSYSAGSRFSSLPAEIPFNAKTFKTVWAESIEKESTLNPDGFTSNKKEVVKERQIDFNKVMEDIKSLVMNTFNPSNRMDIVTDVTEKHLGAGVKVTSCTEKQADLLEIILSELEEKATALGLI